MGFQRADSASRAAVIARTLIALLALALTALTGAGCGSKRIITVSTKTETIESIDGSRITAHRLGPYPDSLERDFDPWGIVAYVQDSAPRSVLTVTPRMAEVIALNMFALLIEHRGVTPDGAVNEMVFWIGSTHRKRVEDHLAAIYRDLPRLRPTRPLMVIAEGEGGQVAATMVRMEPRITHLILLNTGGGWTGEREMRHWLEQRGEIYGLRSAMELEEAIEAVRTDPESLEMLGPRAYTAIAGRLDRTIVDELGPRRLPILLIHATGDQRIPVESARALRDLAERHDLDLTYVEIDGADHRFRDLETGQSRYTEVELAITDWLAHEEVISSRTAKRLRRRLQPNQ
jgi:fermentation-respiration switch protein FrsA (DUF1100 family)